MKATFYGAAQNVTGSKHLIESGRYNLLLDCGMYQGKRDEANNFNKNFPFEPKKINSVILSHAHLDHCGLLPLLVKQGFSGKIYCTPETADITRYILKDAAEIQKHDCLFLKKCFKVIYTESDVQKVLPLLTPINYFSENKQWIKLNSNIRFKFYNAGHILGSAVTAIEIKENNQIKTIAYTGDLGQNNVPILKNSQNIEENIDIFLTEATYGNKIHPPLEDASLKIINAVKKTIKNKAKIIIPAFSLGRTQEIIYLLHKLINQKRIPNIPICIDSPLSTSISKVFEKYEKKFNQQAKLDFKNNESIFEFSNLNYISSIEDSKKLNYMSGPMIIMSSSGMCEAGRILHHLKHNISDKNNTILITGFQAEITLALS